MKKRLKGLLALWMVLLIAVFMPIFTYAATINDVYYYTGTEALNEGDKVASQDRVQLTGDNAFKVGTSFSEQFSSKIPTGYSVIGWKLWKASSGFVVSDAYELSYDSIESKKDLISEEDFDSHFTPPSTDYYEDISYAVVEPLLELSYKLTHQPTNDEPYVSVNEEGVVSAYEWYSVQTEEYSVAEQVSVENEVGSYDSDSGIWSSTGSDETWYALNLSVGGLTVGDTLQITPIDNTKIEEINVESGDGFLLSENNDGVWTGTILSQDYYYLYINSSSAFSVNIKGIHKDIALVDGQNTSVFSGPNGTYYCKVNFTNGASLDSKIFTYIRYDITSTNPSNGSYKFQVGGVDAEKAASGDIVTIVTNPDTGYELDTITVTKTGDTDGSSAPVTVTDNCFTMPDYPVTVNVTFKKLTYAITLPTDTVGYTVESTQTTPVEHGSDYTFTVTIEDGYAASDEFTVTANSNVLSATNVDGNVYTYTIQNVTEAQEITVTGVVEKHAITKIEATGGNYTVNAADGSEVTAVHKDEIVTVKPVASEGYTLDRVIVTKTGDSSTVITVTDGTFTMPDYPVTVSVSFKKLTYKVSFPTDTVGYTVASSQDSPVEHGSSYTFTVTINEDYATSADFAVRANNVALDVTNVAGNVYTYTIKNVTEAQTITVAGVVDATAPEVTITLDENNWWKKLLNKISFGLFFKEEKSLTIDATDAESGIQSVKYYLTDKDLFPEEKSYTAEEIESKITEWNSYTDRILLSGNKKYVLYAKATDKEGNVTYASTTGIVIDTMKPAISGIQDEATYYGDISFTVSDDYLKSVTIDGKQVQPVDGVYTVTADNSSHTIAAEDQAGNSVTYGIYVYKKYDITLPEENESYTVGSSQTSPVEHGSSYSFTVTINEGYDISADFAVRANNVALEATDVNGNVYTYSIKNVTEAQTITVAGVVLEKYAITKTEATGGNYTVTKSDDSEVIEAIKDTKVTITATPDIGYELDAITVTKTGDTDDSSAPVTVTDGVFTMPDYSVTVSVSFKKITYAITLPTETVGYSVESSQTTPVEHGSNYTFTITIKEGYAASADFAVKANNVALEATDVNGNVYTYSIKNVTEAQTITVAGVVLKKYAITKTEATGGNYTVTTSDGSEVTEAIKDTKVTITATPEEGYELDTITVTKIGDSSTSVEVVNNSFTMPDYPVTVSVTFKKLTYKVSLPTDTVGYTVASSQDSPVEHGSSYTFTVTINKGYGFSESFEVNANTTTLDVTNVDGNVYTYTIQNVTEAQTITVAGVVDATAPEVTITLDENNWWQRLLNKISFGLFFKAEKSLTIDATDAESGIQSVKYYLTDKDLFPEEKSYTAEEIESKITEWNSYTDRILLSGNKKYVLYAKATDKEGNVTYASTTGIVIDTMTPAISGIQDEATYYGDISFTVSDDYLKSVTIDGKQVQPVDGVYTVTADNSSHTIAAEDQAGNSVTYGIYVYKKYDITLPEENESYTVESEQISPVEHGSDYTFTVTINEDYATSADFTVSANNVALDVTNVAGNVYTYTIKNVTEAQTITVAGVVLKKYAITKTEATGGNYTVTKSDGSEVTEAIKDTKVTITATPEEGYELDTITVTKIGDSSTSVEVVNNSFTMPDYPVTVSVSFKKLTYKVSLPTDTLGYTVASSQDSPVEHGSSYTFTVTINKGYGFSESFEVNANTTTLDATNVDGNVYTYTIQNVTEAQTITVAGVVDATAPEVTITLDKNNWWQRLLNKISFGLLFKEEKSLTIDATDAESGIQSVKYYLTDKDLFPEEKTYTAEEIENKISGWKEYKESIPLTENQKYVLYAKATDKEGNVSYASTTGIVIDTMVPTISGIKNGGIYYGDILFTISDDNIDRVIINGVTLELTDATNIFTIIADNHTHTIQAADKAGNLISYQISVYESWMKDGLSSGGEYHLEMGIPYKLSSGKWKVEGDDTIYEGGKTFYVEESGTFVFQKQ